MTKRVFIIHGWEATPESEFHPWLKKELEAKGFEVITPEMPDTAAPKINAWVGKLSEIVGKINEDTYFIGHSIGCQTILRYLETLPVTTKIGGVVLLAPWMHLDKKTMKEEGEEGIEIAKPWVETPLNWSKVTSHIKGKIVAIFSDNDPYVPLTDSEIFKEKLNAKIIIEKEKGHFTDDDGCRYIVPSVSKIPLITLIVRSLL